MIDLLETIELRKPQDKVAIKILEKKKIRDVNDVERVTREIHILKIVRHPHIIQLYEIIETQSRLYLIMEHCSNGELFDYITSKNRLKDSEACRLFQQLISAIEYLGELGIAHRDIKPENLLIDQYKNIKIVDFGLSNLYQPGEKLATACGSPCYAAPELIKGKEYNGQKSDLWSCGVVLFTEVSGYLPFEDQNTQSLYQKILKADFQFPEHVSNDARDLVQNILVPDPDLRYGIKQIKQHRWFKIYNPDIPIPLGIKVGIDQFQIYSKILREMKQQTGQDEKYAKQCLEANRHNSITAHYYLLLKHKIFQGEELEEGEISKRPSIIDQAIPVSLHSRTYKSVVAPKHSSLAQNKQLRKIAEGLQEINLIKINPTSINNSLERIQQQKLDQELQNRQIKSPTLIEDQTLLDELNSAQEIQLLRQTDNLNRSFDYKQQYQPLAGNATISDILNLSQDMNSVNYHTSRAKTKYKILNAGNKQQQKQMFGTLLLKDSFTNRSKLKSSNKRTKTFTNNNEFLQIQSNLYFPRENNLDKNYPQTSKGLHMTISNGSPDFFQHQKYGSIPLKKKENLNKSYSTQHKQVSSNTLQDTFSTSVESMKGQRQQELSNTFYNQGQNNIFKQQQPKTPINYKGNNYVIRQKQPSVCITNQPQIKQSINKVIIKSNQYNFINTYAGGPIPTTTRSQSKGRNIRLSNRGNSPYRNNKVAMNQTQFIPQEVQSKYLKQIYDYQY